MSTSLIHPHAVVDSAAQLGRNVRVGPGAIIEAGAIVGDDCEIRANAIITGSTTLGSGNQVGYGAVVGAEPQDLGYKGAPTRVVIGNNNVLREYATVHRGTKEGSETVVGDNNFLMVGVHVAHNCRIGNHVIIVNNVLLAGYVEIQDRAFLGGGSVIHQFTRVGELAIMRGLTRISKDVPPYFAAATTNHVSGLNRVGMKRAGLTPEARRSVQNLYVTLYRSGLNTTQAMEKLESEPLTAEARKVVEFIRASKRGICAAIQNDSEED